MLATAVLLISTRHRRGGRGGGLGLRLQLQLRLRLLLLLLLLLLRFSSVTVYLSRASATTVVSCAVD